MTHGIQSEMRVAFRTDASLQIGTGHVMRCLTLADALRDRGARCTFICRQHTGHLLDVIAQRGHLVVALPTLGAMNGSFAADPAHAAWLGTDWQTDAQDTLRALDTQPVDWLVVDHYALDARWESALALLCGQVMVIDDLADRPHACQLLLDQTFGRAQNDYRPVVPTDCTLLCGSSYALLRPEFAALRPYSLKRRAQPQLKQLLITLGGVDKDNITSNVLAALHSCPLPDDCKIIVIMGTTAPWRAEVQQKAENMPWSTTVRVGVNNMAQLMADSDLAIGAAGATSWERCCLGLPTIMLVLADNQLHAAMLLERAGAACLMQRDEPSLALLPGLIAQAIQSATTLRQLIEGAKVVTDGMGTQRVAQQMMTEKVYE